MTVTTRLRSLSQGSSGSSSSLKRSVKSLVEKVMRTVKQMAHETLDDSDTDFEYRTVSTMFVEPSGAASKTGSKFHEKLHRELSRENRLSSNSETLAVRSTETDGYSRNDERESNNETASDFLTFDPVQERIRLRQQDPNHDATFTKGPEIWQKRRELWLKATADNTLAEAEKNRAAFSSIGPKKYMVIYKKLIGEEATLRRSLNLQDVIKVINAGWVESSKWDRAAQGIA